MIEEGTLNVYVLYNKVAGGNFFLQFEPFMLLVSFYTPWKHQKT